MNEQDLLYELLMHDENTILKNDMLLKALVDNGFLSKLGGEQLHTGEWIASHYIVKKPFMHYETNTMVTT